MKVTLVMKSGAHIDFNCSDASYQRNLAAEGLRSLTLENVKGRNFLYVNLSNIDAVLFEKTEQELREEDDGSETE